MLVVVIGISYSAFTYSGLGKKENNLSNIRALYRFENREELMHAEADQIVVTTTELLDVIWNHRSEKLYI